ncbi:MAG: DNA polymerase III subunit delta' [Myxococcales bacterium]|nr:DNA polymerase III subunit delta' [Myxococcales bacterium]MCB9530676.1 DNA polymerase III subunit delta' [Myxococcales bacterium]MCB9533597.1 DNA polymerase III subunit delta' [Myxococcales bacterium]
MSFASIRGHQRALDILKRSIHAGRVHHAYLFAGPDGVGKRRVALALAAAVNCAAPVDGDACGQCGSCHKVASDTHPDVLVVEPDGRFIKIDQVRDLQARSRYRPYEGARRVFVIDGAELLRDEAANALLKGLEEPRGDTMFVLVSSQPQRLLTTIRSRCQELRFGRLPLTDLGELLAALRPEASGPTRESAARVAEGSVSAALVALESPVHAARPELVGRLLALRTEGVAPALAWAEELTRPGAPTREVLGVFRSALRDAALVAAGASPDRVLNAELAAAIAGLAASESAAALVGATERVGEAEAMLDGNVNPRMTMESLLLALTRNPTRPLAPGLR